MKYLVAIFAVAVVASIVILFRRDKIMADNLDNLNRRLKASSEKTGQAVANIRDDIARLKAQIAAGVDTAELEATVASIESQASAIGTLADETPEPEPTPEPTPTPTPEPVVNPNEPTGRGRGR